MTRFVVLVSFLSLTGCGMISTGSLGSTVHIGGQAGAAGQAQATAPPPANASASVSASVSVEFFDVDLTGAQDVVFVLDHSGSMSGPAPGVNGSQLGMNETESAVAGLGMLVANAASGGVVPTKMELAKQELIDALNAMPDGTRVNVVFFESSVTAFAPGLIALNAGTRNQLIQFVQGIEETGGTAAVPALDAAYAMNLRHVVLLSDGLANSGGDGDDLLSRARAQISRGVRFDTVGLGFDQDGELMTALAHESGGINVMR